MSPMLDVLIVGAGLSGVGMACHLQRRCPWARYAILEAREASGGTWDLFRYPGVRSDSDMFTLGYAFRPWVEFEGDRGRALDPRPTSGKRRRNTASTNRLRIARRSFPRLSTRRVGNGRSRRSARGRACVTPADFLMMCSGYYRYDRGYFPDFPGLESFAGRVVHPQFWPRDFDYAGKRVLVIGSGATAVTIVPEMAKTAAEVTMLQRSPTYMVSRPSADAFANSLRARLPARLAYALTRVKNVLLYMTIYRRVRKHPEEAKKRLIEMASADPRPRDRPRRFHAPLCALGPATLSRLPTPISSTRFATSAQKS